MSKHEFIRPPFKFLTLSEIQLEDRRRYYGEIIRLCERFNLNEMEVDTFAVAIAKSMKITRVRAWHEIEKMLERIENEKEKI